jgi:GR25 family glycosyltransferase involved in LPS biosynthesis
VDFETVPTTHQENFPFNAFLINLDSRRDRFLQATIEAQKINLSLTRISALTPQDLDASELDHSVLTPGALACLKSHQAVWKLISEGDAPFGLVLEDDFKFISKKKFLGYCNITAIENFDILQLGYLRSNFRYWIDINLQNVESVFFIFMGRVSQAMRLNLETKLRIRRHMHLEFRQVADDFRAGAHAYIISKVAAKELLKINQSDFVTVDGYLCVIAWTRYLRVIRVSKPVVTQRKSESSIRGWGSEGSKSLINKN